MDDKTMEYVQEFYDSEDYMVYPLTPEDKKVTSSDVESVEKILEIKFPEEYKAHILGTYPGMLIEVKEDIWPRRRGGGAAWEFFYGLQTFTASKYSENWMRLEFGGKGYKKNTGLKIVPILRIIQDADDYCVTENGTIVQYSHEENNITEINMNFWELLEKELKALNKRKEEMKIKVGNKNK